MEEGRALEAGLEGGLEAGRTLEEAAAILTSSSMSPVASRSSDLRVSFSGPLAASPARPAAPRAFSEVHTLTHAHTRSHALTRPHTPSRRAPSLRVAPRVAAWEA